MLLAALAFWLGRKGRGQKGTNASRSELEAKGTQPHETGGAPVYEAGKATERSDSTTQVSGSRNELSSSDRHGKESENREVFEASPAEQNRFELPQETGTR